MLWRPCRECGKEIVLRIKRDQTRKFYCSRICRGRWLGRQRDMTAMWAKRDLPETNAKKGRKGPLHPNWTPVGHKSVTDQGYIKVKIAPGKWDYEHRLVAKTPKDMVTHHRDGSRTNNIPSNLETLSNSDHARLHAQLRR